MTSDLNWVHSKVRAYDKEIQKYMLIIVFIGEELCNVVIAAIEKHLKPNEIYDLLLAKAIDMVNN